MYSELLIEQKTNQLSSIEFNSISELIYKENPNSVVGALNKNLLFEYLNMAIFSDKIFLFTGKIKNQIVCYAILAEKPGHLISEFSALRIKILKSLLKKVKLHIIFNILLMIIKLDKVFISKKNNKIISDSLNLNMLAVKQEHQSLGIGSFFLNTIITLLNNNNKYNAITLESLDQKAYDFYTNKLGFSLFGIKVRLFKNLKILIKFIDKK
jgi:hypothetical protein